MAKIQKWEIISEKDISPSPWFPLHVDRVKLPNGKITEYYAARAGDVAMIIPITRDREIIFVKQYKHGVREILLELPAGRLDNRNPEQAARDELLEETGIIAKKFTPVGQIITESSKNSIHISGFLAENVEITEKQQLDETENIEIVKIPIKEIDHKIKSGEICCSETITILTLAKLKFPKLF